MEIDITLGQFKTEHILRGLLLNTKAKRDPPQTSKCVHVNAANATYIGKTGGALAVRLR